MIFSVVICIIPLASVIYLKRNFNKLQESQLREVNGSLYEEYSYGKPSTLFMPLIFMARRLLIALAAWFLQNYPSMQILLLLLQSKFVIAYYVYTQPFENRASNLLETFNEISIIIIVYHLFLLTDFFPDLNRQYNVGWSILLVTIINILVNMIFMTVVSAKLTYHQIKSFFFKLRKRWQNYRGNKAQIYMQQVNSSTFQTTAPNFAPHQKPNDLFEISGDNSLTQMRLPRKKRLVSRPLNLIEEVNEDDGSQDIFNKSGDNRDEKKPLTVRRNRHRIREERQSIFVNSMESIDWEELAQRERSRIHQLKEPQVNTIASHQTPAQWHFSQSRDL